MVIFSKIHRLLLGLYVAAVCIVTMAVPGMAASIHDFNGALDGTMRHYRWAGFYLRTGNIALAQLELDAFAAGAGQLSDRYALSPPDLFARDGNWRGHMESLAAVGRDAVASVEAGDIEQARRILAPIRKRIGALRRGNGLFLFADCIDMRTAVTNWSTVAAGFSQLRA
ncbi:MAG: hypothetical protein HOM07_21245, partial [Rhodospirillaceae bacterium]|nr:hypothetical protein [Rhodospirillaceae bacterium]